MGIAYPRRAVLSTESPNCPRLRCRAASVPRVPLCLVQEIQEVLVGDVPEEFWVGPEDDVLCPKLVEHQDDGRLRTGIVRTA